MTENEQRLIELTYRYKILDDAEKKLRDDLQNATLLMLAGAFDKDAEKKQTGILTIIKKWMKEIEVEIDMLDDKVFLELTKNDCEKFEKKLKDEVKGDS